MADNVAFTPGSGATGATDEIGGVHYPRVKPTIGADGTAVDLSPGAGAVDTGTQRTTLASDDPAVAKLGTIDTDTGVIAGAIKAIDDVAGSTDPGVVLLGKHVEDHGHLTTSDGDYDVLRLDSLGSLSVNAEAHYTFDELNATTGWTAVGADVANIATTAKHLVGTAALTYDKDGTAATTAGIQKTVTSIDLGKVHPHDLIQGGLYLASLTNVSYAWVRLGTDSSNYNEWRGDVTNLTAAEFIVIAAAIGDANHTGITGNGWDSSAITYIALGVEYDSAAATTTTGEIIFDQLSFYTNQHTAASINSEVTSTVNSSNVNIHKVGNKNVNKEAGNVSTGTQRVTLATDDVNTAAINVSTAAHLAAVKGEYETVAAAQTAQVLGASGAIGDYISHILVIPATLSPGVVTLLDNATSIPVFVGGASSLTELKPFKIDLSMVSVSGAWKITTGANVSAIGVGVFT